MTFFLDTSALVKLYLDETDSSYVRSLITGSRPVVCRFTWAEAVAAMARRNREASAAIDWLNPARQSLREDWPRFMVVDVTQALVERAGEFADVFALRGFDAVQLAAADAAQHAAGEPLSFLAFDRRLNSAARLLGLALPEGAPC